MKRPSPGAARSGLGAGVVVGARPARAVAPGGGGVDAGDRRRDGKPTFRAAAGSADPGVANGGAAAPHSTDGGLAAAA